MPYQTEALAWLKKNKKKSALAGNHFESTQEAVEAVEKLYAAGATRVDVWVKEDDPQFVDKYGGEYSEELIVCGEKGKTSRLVDVIKSLIPDNFVDEVTGLISWTGATWDGSALTLWWD
jgi:hypothetical protein